MDTLRHQLLQKYHVTPDDRLSSGMEAETYAYGSDAVFKLYAGTARLTDLLTLRDFYAELDRDRVPYALPQIHTVAQEDDFLITIERRLVGTPLSAALPSLNRDQMDAVMHRYLTAALALSQIEMSPSFERYKLFDPDHLSARGSGDWHQFLLRYLTHKLAEVGPYLKRDVPQFAERVGRLRSVLDQPYQGDARLIHGDFFPGNLLVDDSHSITALLDFGLFTMYGDPFLDIALGWVFFDMYDELKINARERYLSMVLERLGGQVRGRLYCYVLLYSIVGSNTYSPDCSDGHYAWCVANLNHEHYWRAIG